jgi:MSHA biogenesis protein MshQ
MVFATKTVRRGFLLFCLSLFFCGQAKAVGTLIAHYQFDSCDWQNTGIVVDTVGTQNGTPTGMVSRDTTPTSGLKPDTCSSASFGGGAVDVDPLPVSTVASAQTSVSFWMYWDGTNNVMPMGWRYHDLWFISGSFGFNTGNGDIYGISSAGLANGWHHVAAVFTNNDIYSNVLYIDGVQQVLTQRRNTPNNSLAVVDPHLRISGWWGSNGYRFSGRIDEFKVYTGDVTQAQVDADRAATTGQRHRPEGASGAGSRRPD